MNIQIASDLHLEFVEQQFPGYRVIEPAGADVLIIAGDIHRNIKAVAAFADWPVPVVYVHGNHEVYHQRYDELIAAMRAATAGTNVHFLECDQYIVSGVRFLGCCLWTDYCLQPADWLAAMAEAEQALNDHRVIRTEQGSFTTADALRIHQQSRAWLEARLAEDFDGPTVVVTHHGVHPNSTHPKYAGMRINAAFASDLGPLLQRADLWVHGHVHDSFDYRISQGAQMFRPAGTRVIANPRGYPLNRPQAKTPAQLEWENTMFNPRLVVEV